MPGGRMSVFGKSLYRCVELERESRTFEYCNTHPLRPRDADRKSRVVDSAENRCQCGLLCRLKGSVFPRALVVALPSVVILIFTRYLIDKNNWSIPDVGGNEIWSGYNGALAFLLIFRTQKAYARWWEGGTLLQQVRGEWYTAASNLVAFCTTDSHKFGQTRDFQHLMVRLMSLLYCSALQQVAMLDDDCFEILNTDGLDASSLDYLHASSNRCEVIISWLQRLIIENIEHKVIVVDAPIVSRVFQEISRGFVNLNNVRKIREFPFPFPYAQMITLMLVVHWIIMPIASCLLVDNIVWASVLTFVTIFAFWCINFIAEEIEMPFGDDANDLPIAFMQRQMNASLFTLLQKGSQKPPSFTFRKSVHANSAAVLEKAHTFREECQSPRRGRWTNVWPDQDHMNSMSQSAEWENMESGCSSDRLVDSIKYSCNSSGCRSTSFATTTTSAHVSALATIAAHVPARQHTELDLDEWIDTRPSGRQLIAWDKIGEEISNSEPEKRPTYTSEEPEKRPTSTSESSPGTPRVEASLQSSLRKVASNRSKSLRGSAGSRIGDSGGTKIRLNSNVDYCA